VRGNFEYFALPNRASAVTDTSAKHLPKDVLFDLLPASFEPWGSHPMYLAAPPTSESVNRINADLGITLPTLFIEVAAACSSYGGWFNSVGDDYESHMHMVNLNRSWREEGLPDRYVLLIHGHDGYCDAWDRDGAPVNGELPIAYFHYNVDRHGLTGLKPSAQNFADYIDRFVRDHAPRCPIKNLRRRAKRILALYS
jgi:hypothetical protein